MSGKESLGALLSALHFLTTIPLLPQRPYSHAEFGRAVGFFPLVGLLIGGILAGLNALLKLAFPPAVAAALTLTAWVALTGALHLDGLLDSLDGLLGGHDAATRLEIMKDERVGAFGFAGGVLLLLVKFAALNDLPAAQMLPALILAPVLPQKCVVRDSVTKF